MSTMAKNIIATRVYNRPPMLEKSQYNTWQSHMLLYIRGKESGKELYDSVINDPFQFGMVDVPTTPTTLAFTSDTTFEDLIKKEKIHEACDIRATNIVLHGLPLEFILLFAQLINDMNTIGMTLKKLQVNNKLVNNIQLKWSKFVTNVKLAKDMHKSSFDQLYAYLRQHEVHANEVCMMRQQFHDPLALVANTYNIPPYYNNHQPQYNPPQYHSQSLVIPQQQFYTSLPQPYEALVHQQSYYAPVVHQW
ncbi:hypothetical protein Tco_1127527 [Tanacetum coccineum]